MNGRTVLTGVGVAAVGTGVAVAAGVGPTTLDGAAGPVFVLVTLLAGAVAAVGLLDRTATGPTSAVVGDRRSDGVTIPGADVDRTLASLGGDPAARAALEERVRPLAVEAVVRSSSLDRQEAQAAIEEGTWTDDERAARFLAVDPSPPGRTAHLRALLAGQSVVAGDAARAIEQVARLTAEGDRED